MAEAITVVGLLASVAQLIEFGTAVVTRVVDFQRTASGAPKALQGLVANLPLILHALKRIAEHAKAGSITSETTLVLFPVIGDCHEQIKTLYSIIGKVLPKQGDSTLDRSRKAIQSIAYEKDIDKLMKGLMEHLTVLLLYGSIKSHVSSVPINKHMRVFNVPFARDLDYLDRPLISDKLRDALESQKMAVLAGLGGVGKSQIAIEYCYRFQEQHPDAHIIWQHVSTFNKLVNGWLHLAQEMEIPGHDKEDADLFKLVSDHLTSGKAGSWLLVLDNADDKDVIFRAPPTSTGIARLGNLASNLPRFHDGRILITTRDSRVGEGLASAGGVILVSSLEQAEATTLLKSKVSNVAWDDQAATKLVSELDFIPLAITQAGAFITQNVVSIEEYLELLRAGSGEVRELLEADHYDRRRYGDSQSPVLQTWKLSFDIVDKQKPQATQILCIMAVMDRQNIPESLLLLPGLSKIQKTLALGLLKAFSLISPSKDGNAFNIHRLVQLAIVAEAERKGTLISSQKQALQNLFREMPGDALFANWPKWYRLVSHIEALLAVQFDDNEARLDQMRLMPAVAAYYCEQGRYEASQQKLNQLLRLTQMLHGSQHIETATCKSHLGHLAQTRSRYVEAEALHREAAEIRTNILGSEDPLTMESFNNLGGALWWQGKYNEAMQVLETNLTKRQTTLGREDPDTLKTMMDLAATFERLGNHDRAETMFREVLTVNEHILGSKHDTTIQCTRSLASNLQIQGKHDEAHQLFHAAWLAKVETAGREHPEALVLQEYQAGSLFWQKKLEDAEKLQREVWTSKIDVLPGSHPSTLESMQLLAGILHAMKRYHESEMLLREVVDQRRKTLGDDHVDTLRSMTELARDLFRTDRTAEAEQLHAQVYEAKLRTVGEHHPQTLESMDYMAGVLLARGEKTAAIDMQQKVLKLRRKVQGPSHPQTLSSMDSVIGSLWGEGDLSGATELLRESLQLREEFHLRDKPELLLEHLARLAYLIRIQGEKDEAIELYEKARQISEQHFGPEHDETKDLAVNVTDTLAEKVAAM